MLIFRDETHITNDPTDTEQCPRISRRGAVVVGSENVTKKQQIIGQTSKDTNKATPEDATYCNT